MNSKDEDIPAGFTCKCGRYEKFPPYVYAHWTITLDWNCPDCQRKWTVRRGHVFPKKGAKR